MLEFDFTSRNLGKVKRNNVINFCITGTSTYGVPVTIQSKGACGCTTTKDVNVNPGEKFEIKGQITGRSTSGKKSVRIYDPLNPTEILQIISFTYTVV